MRARVGTTENGRACKFPKEFLEILGKPNAGGAGLAGWLEDWLVGGRSVGRPCARLLARSAGRSGPEGRLRGSDGPGRACLARLGSACDCVCLECVCVGLWVLWVGPVERSVTQIRQRQAEPRARVWEPAKLAKKGSRQKQNRIASAARHALLPGLWIEHQGSGQCRACHSPLAPRPRETNLCCPAVQASADRGIYLTHS